LENPNGGDHLEDVGVTEKAVQWILGTQGGKVWTGCTWFSIGTSGGPLWKR